MIRIRIKSFWLRHCVLGTAVVAEKTSSTTYLADWLAGAVLGTAAVADAAAAGGQQERRGSDTQPRQQHS